jgi:hypothetical protein
MSTASDGLRIAVNDERTIVMTMSDWHALNQIDYAAIDYVERVIQAQATVDLGCEVSRYDVCAGRCAVGR